MGVRACGGRAEGQRWVMNRDTACDGVDATNTRRPPCRRACRAPTCDASNRCLFRAPMVSERQRAVVNQWARALHPYRSSPRRGTAHDRFVESGSLDDVVAWMAEHASADGYCCYECGFPVRDPPMHPEAVIEAMLAGRVEPEDALRALAPKRFGLEFDARIEAIDEARRRDALREDVWCTPPTALRFGVWHDELYKWGPIGDSDEWQLSDALYDAIDPSRSTLALRTLLRSETRTWFLGQFASGSNYCIVQWPHPWLADPRALRFVRALVTDSPKAVEAALDAIDDEQPVFVTNHTQGPPIDLRESFALLCAHFGFGALAERQLRAVLRCPAVRAFDSTMVALAPHAHTTQAVLALMPERSREALEEWAFCALDRRDASANEWIALAQWSNAARADACFNRALAKITANDRADEPFDGALLPRTLQEHVAPISAARLRRWLDRRLRPEHDDANEDATAHFRLRWFSPENPAAVAQVYEAIRDAMVAATATEQTSLVTSARAWLCEVESRRDGAMDLVLDELDPLCRRRAPLAPPNAAFESFSVLLQFAPAADRTRWIETIIERCPCALRCAWPWATAEQQSRMVRSALGNTRSLVTVVADTRSLLIMLGDRYAKVHCFALEAACMDRWVRIGCPLDASLTDPNLARIHRHFAEGGRDRCANAWQLSRDALRDRLRAQLEQRSLDWTIDPGPEWVAKTLGSDPADDALFDALFEQHWHARESVRWPYYAPEYHPLHRRARSEVSWAEVPPSAEAALPEDALRRWDLVGDLAESLFALHRMTREGRYPNDGEIIAWLARVAPERLGPLGDRVLDVLLTHCG